jgi:hypothetical protein
MRTGERARESREQEREGEKTVVRAEESRSST